MKLKVWLIVFVLLILLFVRLWGYFHNLPVYKNGDRIVLATRLTEQPEIRMGMESFMVTDKFGTRIRVNAAAGQLYNYGDNLLITGTLTIKNQFYSLYYPKVKIVNSEHNYLSQVDVYIKKTSKELFDGSIPMTSSALLMGMVFGGNQGMPKAFMDKLRITGVIHVIAASGMNVTMAAGVFISLLGKILKRQIVLLLSILGVLFYAFLAGFEPSIVRAAIMVAISLGAGFLGRQYLAQFALLLTGYLMLIYRPANLFDIGFQLSFLSTWGILILKPLMPFQKFFLADDMGTTMAAQLATFPVLFATFGQYGLLSLLVNICVLWTVPFLMIFGAIGAIGGMVFVPLGKLFVWISLPFLMYFERVVSFFADLNWVWRVDSLTWPSI